MTPDIKALIHAIELRKNIAKRDHHGFVDLPYEMVGNVLVLLKEQQQQIWELQDQVEYLTDKLKEQKFLVDSDGKITPLPVVVRCKDCKHFDIGIDVDGKKFYKCIGSVKAYGGTEPDWFCADGEKRE